jgi:hypothetical protein
MSVIMSELHRLAREAGVDAPAGREIAAAGFNREALASLAGVLAAGRSQDSLDKLPIRG